MTPTSGRRTALTASLLALPLTLAACSPADLLAPPTAGAAELTDFGSCEELLDYFQEHALEQVGPWGFGMGAQMGAMEDMAGAAEGGDVSRDRAAASDSAGGGDGGGDFSGTNNQEEGVEEPDIVQTDGEIIVTSVQGRMVVVDVASGQKVGAVALPSRRGGTGAAELLLDRANDRVLALTREWGGGVSPLPRMDGMSTYPAFESTRTVVTLVDISDPSTPTVSGSIRLEGDYRSARMQDGTARVVMVTTPPGLSFVQPTNGSLVAEEAAEAANREIVEATTLDDWLPHVQTLGADATRSAGTELAVPCEDIARPPEFSGLSTMSVLTIDLGASSLDVGSASGLVASGSTVYASTDRLVVATSPWEAWSFIGPDIMPRGASGPATTTLHTFDLSEGDSTDYVASGTVEGRLLNQFSVDEADGIIRVATTQDGRGSTSSSSSLVVLAEDGDRLVEQGRVDGLGKTEQIYAVRYLSADTAAVVTFRQTDPLYLVDTSDPTAPEVTGELKIPGYSAYLHPLGDGLLLGVGQDATDEGQTTGLQVSLFDISDPSAPTQVSKQTWVNHYSEVEHDHRAFTSWPQTGQVFLPAYAWTEKSEWGGVVSAQVGGGTVNKGPELQLSGGTGQAWDSARRTLVIGDELWVLGERSLHRVDLSTLESRQEVEL